MTNFEKIKTMSVEEMARALAKYNAREVVCRRSNERSSLDFCKEHDCAECCLAYLKREEKKNV